MKTNISLAHELKNILKERNMSFAELSRLIGVTRTDISILFKKLESNKSITTSKLFKILSALNISITFLED